MDIEIIKTIFPNIMEALITIKKEKIKDFIDILIFVNDTLYYNDSVNVFYEFSTNYTLSTGLLETSNRDYTFNKRNINKKLSSLL